MSTVNFLIVLMQESFPRYLSKSQKELNIEDFNNDQICPLVKLLVYDFMKQQFDEKLLS